MGRVQVSSSHRFIRISHPKSGCLKLPSGKLKGRKIFLALPDVGMETLGVEMSSLEFHQIRGLNFYGLNKNIGFRPM